MLDPSASLSVVNLPQQPLSVLEAYHGADHTGCHSRRKTARIRLHWYAPSGSDGYLIADALGFECERCLDPGVMEMISVPVPGHCNLYYIFTTRSGVDPVVDTENRTRTQVAMLDLSAENHWFPERKGALINLGSGTPDVPGVTLDLESSGETEYIGWLEYSYKGESNTPMLRAIDPVGNGNLFWLYMWGRNPWCSTASMPLVYTW